ncbi:hypothetical protein J3Q64DRAFT_1825732 [Phycomyces blakesleeanus]|uniref:PHD-type domain-containing protein n=1 Tax=Phycomyces blakesleeanus TaxID=4837 RepID=A0ABR3AMH9_PHYBL
MTDKFCFALLRITTLQILQSAGYESVHIDPTDILTDVFGQYIQMLGATTNAYAQLAGRTTGTLQDVVDGLEDLAVDTNTLRDWLEEEGKALTPTWSASSDPGRFLQGVVKHGRPSKNEGFLYSYQEVPDPADKDSWEEAIEKAEEVLEDAEYGDEEEYEEEEDEYKEENKEEEERKKENNAAHENALPDYIPPYFPPFPSDPKEEPEQTAAVQPLTPISSLPIVTTTEQPNTLLPSVVVKTRKKPIENPFTYITPFEESTLAADKETPQPLSLTVTTTIPTHIASSAINTNTPHPLQKQPSSKRRRIGIQKMPLDQVIKSLDTKPSKDSKSREKLPGNQAIFRRFTQDEAAPGNTMFGRVPGVLGEIVLQVASPVAVSKLSSPNLLLDVASNTTNGAQDGNSSVSTSDTTLSLSKSHGSNNSSSNNITNTNGTSPSVIRQSSHITISHSNNSTNSSGTANSTSNTISVTSNMSSKEHGSHYESHSSLKRTVSDTHLPKTTLTPMSLASLSAASSSSPSSSSGSHAKKKKLPKLTLSLPAANSNNSGSDSHPSSANNTPLSTPKIRFKIKPPEPSEQPVIILPPPKEPESIIQQEIIRCICENPTVDYGTFMIACDKCSVWFHGSCVGIAENDQVEEWFCRSCQR